MVLFNLIFDLQGNGEWDILGGHINRTTVADYENVEFDLVSWYFISRVLCHLHIAEESAKL